MESSRRIYLPVRPLTPGMPEYTPPNTNTNTNISTSTSTSTKTHTHIVHTGGEHASSLQLPVQHF
ncbi:hypothetical protein QF026_008267 [Streptomyces aurantiacus]|uniref:hypothetical protein n=1 Tax=Streptomyces aurantiacus TaxID=47760 RepID=UPI002794294B|nr:hypothetical protein [Streptomyces aurantiacus]MDQ0779801.1 hypothetical protein [Streptomyces aurantiacus]